MDGQTCFTMPASASARVSNAMNALRVASSLVAPDFQQQRSALNSTMSSNTASLLLGQNPFNSNVSSKQLTTSATAPDSVASIVAATPGVVIPTRLHNLTARASTSMQKKAKEKEVALDAGYCLKPMDVLCLPRGSQGSSSGHPGNERFRVLVTLKAERYRKATTSQQRAGIGREIVSAVRQSGANFVRKDGDVWYEIGNRKAREKVRHALRIAVQTMEGGTTGTPTTGRTTPMSTQAKRASNNSNSANNSGCTSAAASDHSSVVSSEDMSALHNSDNDIDNDIVKLPLPEPITLQGAFSPMIPEPEGFREFVRSTFLPSPEQQQQQQQQHHHIEPDTDDWLLPFRDHSCGNDFVNDDLVSLFDPIMKR